MNFVLDPALYEGKDGFHADQQGGGFELLQKALEAGSGVDAASFTGGRALIPESLENTLVNILHTQDEARIFQALKKQTVKSPVHQWDERTEVGADDGAWVSEGGTSQEADQTIARKYTTAKYLQTLRKVTLQASISNTVEDAMVLEQNAGTLWVIRNVERGLIYGNSDFFPLQPDGLEKQIPASNVIDLRGAEASSAAFEDAFVEGCRTIRDHYGRASNFYGSTMIIQDVQKLLRDRLRVGPGMNEGAALFERYPTPFGKPLLQDNIFIKEGTTPSASSITASRPGAVTINSATAASNASSQFTGDFVGDYWYKVAGVNAYGEGAATATGAAVSVASGESVTFNVDVAAPAATAYALYRSKKGASDATDCRFIGYFTYTDGTGDTFIDHNDDLPGTSDGFLLTLGQEYDAIEWAQFLPLMKFDLYPTNAAVYPFLMLLFGSLAVKKTTQHIRIKNISPSGLSWF